MSQFQLYRLTAQHSQYQGIDYGGMEADISQKQQKNVGDIQANRKMALSM